MVSLEVEMIGKAHKLGLLTTPYAFSPDEAVAIAKAGADIIVAHMGLTTSGSIGAKTSVSMEESIVRVQAIANAAHRINPHTIVLCHGGHGLGRPNIHRLLHPKTSLPRSAVTPNGLIEAFRGDKKPSNPCSLACCGPKRIEFSHYCSALRDLESKEMLPMVLYGLLAHVNNRLIRAYRALYILNWMYRYFTEDHYVHWITWISGLVQTLLYADFFYYYFQR
ncbi:hypothetical protein L1049_017635 [Liquidambar formosana]|uniref:TIM-barrel domain-containing protein n=1 Tax=Liquidambar formosana TaxID=63359 RepID=A0AAP0S165_LIQFO